MDTQYPWLMLGDCLERMKEIPDGSVDMILCDLPYGTTACKWDVVIPFEPLWFHYWRVVKQNGTIALFGSEPFSSYLRICQIKYFKYDWIWAKERGIGHLNAKKMPMKSHEIISIFCKKKTKYIPQGTIVGEFNNNRPIKNQGRSTTLMGSEKPIGMSNTGNYPKSIIYFPKDNYSNNFHPTQKPVALLEYLVKTYTVEGEFVLDNTMGSGSTGVACVNTNRRFIGIEKDEKYFEIAQNRIQAAISLFLLL